MNMGNSLTPSELEIMGYAPQYDYTQYSHDNHVNVIPEESFKRLVRDTFKTITDVLRSTYGPYGSTAIISDQNETTTTKDGHNVLSVMNFSHHYKKMVYLAIKKICVRVNRNVGDGTTSCVLLADKIFNEINQLAETQDEKRQLLNVLTLIEKHFQDPSQVDADRLDGMIVDLDDRSFKNIISVASNYDNDLTDTLTEAFAPTFVKSSETNRNVVESIRNVIVEKEVDSSLGSNISYEIDYLPGDYRVRVEMDVDLAAELNKPTATKVAIYDHTFGSSDWNNFKGGYDEETSVFIIAREFTSAFRNTEYTNYLKKCILTQVSPKIFIAAIKGDFIQNEIKDLAAVLNTTVFTINSGVVDHDLLPTVTIQINRGNCLCFHDVEPPINYINKVELEMKKDLTKSYCIRNNYLDRIRSLSMKAKDTRLIVKAASTLELAMITDKIDDCVSIIQSAKNNGVVPNMLRYAYSRTKSLSNVFENTDSEEIALMTLNAISKSIKGLFWDIWHSKYSNTKDLDGDIIIDEFYNDTWCSYDIINDEFCNTIDTLPTSTQYDIEVVSAAISIVKYLLTSRVFVFDAHIMRPTGDQGHYHKI